MLKKLFVLWAISLSGCGSAAYAVDQVCSSPGCVGRDQISFGNSTPVVTALQFVDGTTQTTAGGNAALASTGNWTAGQYFSSITVLNNAYIRGQLYAGQPYGQQGTGPMDLYGAGNLILSMYGGPTAVTNRISFLSTSEYAYILATNFNTNKGLTLGTVYGPATIYLRDTDTKFTGGINVGSCTASNFALSGGNDLFVSSLTLVSLSGFTIYGSTALIPANSSLTLTPINPLGGSFSQVVPLSMTPFNNGLTSNSVEFGAWKFGDTTITLKNNSVANAANVVYTIFAKP